MGTACEEATSTTWNGATSTPSNHAVLTMTSHDTQEPVPSDYDLMKLYDDANYGNGDDLKIYMSMRNNGPQTRQQYLESLEDSRQERLNHESQRIAKLRIKFFTHPTKQELRSAHEDRRREWKKEARSLQANNIKDIDERMCILEAEAISQPRLDISQERNKLRNQRRILMAIKKWPNDEEPSTNAEPPARSDTATTKPEYGLKASIMHFKKGGGGHTHKHIHEKVMGRFPNQKIPIDHLLTKSAENPLNEPCPDNRLRYFHLPTNNMAWIEVICGINPPGNTAKTL